MFAYIALIKAQGVPDYYVQEAQNLSTVFWSFRESAEPGDIVTALASNMQVFYFFYFLFFPRIWRSGVVATTTTATSDAQLIRTKEPPEEQKEPREEQEEPREQTM